ncbi:MAG: hypothetical protein ACO3F2_13935, partial [Roseiflexaceae bacterium]
MSDELPIQPTADYRNKIRHRLKMQQVFKIFMSIWFSVATLVISIWFFTTPFDDFWPIWPMIGMSIPAVIIWLIAYGPPPREITETDIDAEIQRIR